MTYGDQVPTPEAAPAAAPTGRHRAADPDSPMDGLLQDAYDPGGPIVTADDVVFRLPDPEHQLDGVRLEVDWILGDIDPEFTWDDGLWSLWIARPDAWRLEYQLTLRRQGDTTWTSDPGNPRRVPNPFGDKSEIRFPDYREPNWLLTAPAGSLRTVTTSAGSARPAGPGAVVVPDRAAFRHHCPVAAGARRVGHGRARIAAVLGDVDVP